jgi:hypothetical protein
MIYQGAQICGWIIGLSLQLLLIAALQRHYLRRYPLFLLYILADFLTSVIDMSLMLAVYANVAGMKGRRVWWYWVNEGILQVLLFALIVSLIYYATAKIGSRRLMRTALVAGAILFAGASFLIHYRPHLVVSAWMTPWSRDLNFSSAILDLALWAMLISSREKDRRLLIISGGLGIQFTGEAIGEAIRGLTTNLTVVHTGSVIIMIVNLGVLYIWRQAFRTQPSANVASPSAIDGVLPANAHPAGSPISNKKAGPAGPA